MKLTQKIRLAIAKRIAPFPTVTIQQVDAVLDACHKSVFDLCPGARSEHSALKTVGNLLRDIAAKAYRMTNIF